MKNKQINQMCNVHVFQKSSFWPNADVEAILDSMHSNPAPAISPVWLSTLSLAELLPQQKLNLTIDRLTFLFLFIHLFLQICSCSVYCDYFH